MTEPANQLPISDLVAAVSQAIARGPFSEESAARLIDLMDRFASFAEHGRDIGVASVVTGSIVEGFVKARSADGSVPAVATMHIRRAAVRLLFAEGRRLGVVTHDPTLDIVLPPRSSLRARPLTDVEIVLCRSHSIRTLTETRQPAAWALAEATARSAELADIRVRDLDPEHARVWIPGSSKTEARSGSLSDWGVAQIERRLHALRGAHPDSPFVCRNATAGVSATSSASTAITDTLKRAGLHQEADVRPASVAAWAGARAFAAGAPIDQVARLLGIRSLDRAAAFIGFAWTSASQ
jgi:integrase